MPQIEWASCAPAFLKESFLSIDCRPSVQTQTFQSSQQPTQPSKSNLLEPHPGALTQEVHSPYSLPHHHAQHKVLRPLRQSPIPFDVLAS